MIVFVFLEMAQNNADQKDSVPVTYAEETGLKEGSQQGPVQNGIHTQNER